MTIPPAARPRLGLDVYSLRFMNWDAFAVLVEPDDHELPGSPLRRDLWRFHHHPVDIRPNPLVHKYLVHKKLLSAVHCSPAKSSRNPTSDSMPSFMQ